ncbi:huntingtin-interacting protein 1-like [Amphibalanus amphitrite]|uniref:huntingtin-interacting protein 1-like n=1 Tax=Amphibalanus amphitrite TaxID=1232801 RepID=UPI001C92B13A|nr:huntingtin-interacting protein 1-like [Amphibalanus amphitrite]XP_043195502.1 huntingtin-interacting protein 1-like [Amphibalanus amphitrite]XP_043195503.1 huntingtin-interacting protein 1-like [Amphibalanus amphitrite]XP_043195504.1 huntingtin-interacting protein 1-like [Amphibalanus amphitrite]XP_043195505.1 huntingtin-interacting protein 1-like [Amphibalanus amphitrite]
MQRALMNRRATSSLDAQRIEFEKAQMQHFSKATSSQELPVKTKHVRGLIIGTHHERSAHTFWSLAERIPLQDHPITCWKFCHVLHKLLREGYRSTVRDTFNRREMLRELAGFWGHLPDAYGKLIESYIQVLLAKLRFHGKYAGFPGTLSLSDDDLEKMGENDPNSYFEMAVDILDYLEAIVNMQTAVFGSLDMSRSSSMTKEGQCRLAPLIPCIQDSIALYNHAMKIMFRLHSLLPPDLLSGHRQRFNKLFTALKQFYAKSANLQYFKTLIQVPQLPDSPPNFFRSCQRSDQVEAAVILPEEEEEEVDLLVDMSDTASTVDSRLVTPLDVVDEPPPPPPPPRPDVEEQLRHQLLARQQEAAALRSRAEQLEMQLAERESLLLAEQESRAELAARLAAGERTAAAAAAQAGRAAEEKFQKMKGVYQQLREEHIRLIRKKAEVDQQVLAQQEARQRAESAHSALQEQLSSVSEQRSVAEEQLQRSEARSAELANLQSELQSSRSRCAELEAELQVQTTQARLSQVDSDEQQARCRQLQTELEAERQRHRQLNDQRAAAELGDAVSTAEQMVQGALDECDNPMFSAVTCTPEYLLSLVPALEACLPPLAASPETLTPEQRGKMLMFAHLTAQFLLHGRATSSTSPNIQLGEEMWSACGGVASATLQLLSACRSAADRGPQAGAVRSELARLAELTRRVTDSLQAVSAEQIASMVEQEMSAMDSAIEAAAARIQEILTASRLADSGLKLEVSEKILDSCTGLMRAVKLLVQRSRDLQAEIIAQGKGTASPTEFYKRNHRWTEGLISAAKAVGLGAKSLLDAADRLVSGNGKFEELIVVTHEIAASSAQLVIASKVKADRHSQNLANLGQASRGVSEATGSVVATAKSCMELVEDKAALDFSNLSLHQAKRQEMEAQVRVLELEAQLQRARVHVSALRKQHYQLAGELEGWEEVDSPPL